MANYNARNKQYEQYKTQNVMTASPADLTLMLYEGLIKNMKLGVINIEERNIEKSHDALIKAHNIVSELMSSLDMEYELSEQLYAIYDYILRMIHQANVAKDAQLLEIPIELATELKDTWVLVMKTYRHAPTAEEKARYNFYRIAHLGGAGNNPPRLTYHEIEPAF